MSTLEPAQFLRELQSLVRKEAGKALSPLLKRWRYTRSADQAHIPLPPATRQFLIRYGWLDGARDSTAQQQTFQALLARLSRASGEAPGVVAAWLELYAAGEYAVCDSICGSEPRCTICPLQATCRYLSAGGRESRLSGASLAQELTEAGRGENLRAAELLAFLLWGEQSGAGNVARAEAFLKACGGLRGLLQARPEALREGGLNGPALARLQALAEVARLWAGERAAPSRQFTCGKDFFEHFHLRLRDLKKEQFMVVLLDQKHALLGEERVSEGSLTETLVHPREVFATAIERRAAAIAVVHNHPSGDPSPSAADRNLTKRLQSAASVVGIRLLDHVIIGDGRYVSFVEAGLLE